MKLQSDRELENSREKLQRLEECYEVEKSTPDGDAYAQTLTLQSLKRMINQFKEEIARFEAHAGVK